MINNMEELNLNVNGKSLTPSNIRYYVEEKELILAVENHIKKEISRNCVNVELEMDDNNNPFLSVYRTDDSDDNFFEDLEDKFGNQDSDDFTLSLIQETLSIPLTFSIKYGSYMDFDESNKKYIEIILT